MNDMIFMAGTARADITPEPGTLINGEFLPFRAREIHDPLYAKALALRGGGVTIVIVTVDICAMPKDMLDGVREDISGRTGIPLAHIMITATHTHAAGSVADLFLCPPDPEYRDKLPALICEAAEKAVRRLAPAEMARGAADVPEHLVCRRYFMKGGYVARNPVTGGEDEVKTNPFGAEDKIDRRAAATDPQLSYIAFRGTDGSWIGLLANYSMHYVGDKEDTTVTADYFGVFAGHMAELLGAGDDFTGILTNGTSGDVNIWDFISPDRYPKGRFEKSRLIGRDLAENVFRSLEDARWERDGLSIACLYDELSLRLRKPQPEELEAAGRTVKETDYEAIAEIDDKALRRIYAREQVLLAGHPDEIRFPVQAFRIGSLVIGGLGGEFFAETGLRLKEQAGPGGYFTIAFSNGYTGYVPPAHEMERGGYETWRCRTSCLEKGAEERVRTRLLQMIRDLRSCGQ